MDNQEIQAAKDYHTGTKHPNGFLLDPWHRYHPRQEPLKFKIYQGAELIPLPQPAALLGMPALEAISVQPLPPDTHPVPSLEALAQILYYSAGVTKKIAYPWGEIYFRAAACTGALYHIEIYLACADLPGLEAGLYHYEPQVHALARLRQGDFCPCLSEASAQEPAVWAAPAILIFTDMFWRNAVKYQARAYRHTFWDGGTILSNTLAVCAAQQLSAPLVMGFVDEQVNALLGLDVEREASFALVPIGARSRHPEPKPRAQRGGSADQSKDNHLPERALTPDQAKGIWQPEGPEIKLIDFPIQPLGGRQPIRFPAIQDVHAASSLHSPEEVRGWRISPPPIPAQAAQGPRIPLEALTPDHLPQDDLGAVIIRRGSTRQFARLPISFAQLSTLLSASLTGISADFLDPPGARLATPYLIVNAVEGLEAGAYVFHREVGALECLQAGNFRSIAGQLALGQDLAADASVNIFFLTDLDRVLDAYGNRGYRAAQLEAAIGAGRMYLAACAQRFGATGLTFYDDAVTGFFSPHAAGLSVMFLIALGHKARRR